MPTNRGIFNVMEKSDANNMRICHIIGSLKYGGAERQLTNLMNNLNAKSKLIILLANEHDRGFYRLLNKKITIYYMPTRTRYFYYYIIKLSILLRQKRIDVLQTHMYWANFFGTLAGKIAGVPVIITTEHGMNPWKKRWHYWIERRIITKFSDLRICVSRDIMNARKNRDRIPGKKLIYIPNAVAIPAEIKIIENKKTIIGAIGRFIGAKDYSTLIKAAGILKESNIDFEMYILGDGPLRKELENIRAQLGLESIIRMPGFQDNVDEWLIKFDLFVISSKREGQPLVLLEAMSNGLAIVATNVGGIPDTVKAGEEAILVEPGDPEILASAMRDLIDSDSLREKYGKKAKERSEREFSISTICNQYEELYLSIWRSKNK